MSRQRENETPADFLRRMGWGVGTRLTGDDGETIEITAIGRRLVLAVCDNHNSEGVWCFDCREWEVAP